MREKIPAVTTILLILVWMAANSLSAQETGPTIPEIAEPPVIDGLIDDIWHAQPAFAITKLNNGAVENEADNSSEWYGLWDAEYFYLLVDITDQFLEDTAGADLWRNDIIEVYFDMDNSKSGTAQAGDNYQYGFHWNKPEGEYVSPNGSWEGVEWSQTTNDTGYIVEAKIPWATLTTLEIGLGHAFGFDIAVNDNDGFGSYDSVMYWYNPTRSGLWNNMSNAGTVVLGESFDGNYPPELDALETAVAFEGTASVVELSATDLNPSDTLVFDAEAIPLFAELVDNGNGTAGITVNAVAGDAGIYEFPVTVSDGQKMDTVPVVLIVKDPAVPTQVPEFEAVSDLTVIQENQRILQVHAIDLDSLTVEISATVLPDFASLEDNGDKTAAVRFAPDATIETGDYPVTLLVRDPDNNEVSVEFQVRVIADAGITEYYSDPASGSMENDGSASAPWPGLREIMESGVLFDADDVIYLLDGYHGIVVVTAANSETVTVMAAEGAAPRFGKLQFSASSANWHFDGVQVSSTFADRFPGGRMVELAGDNNRVSNFDIFSSADTSGWTLSDWLSRPQSGVQVGGSNNVLETSTITNVAMGIDVAGTFNVVRGNAVHNFTVDGMRIVGNDVLIEDNLITDNYNIDDNHDDGIQSYTFSESVKRVTIRRNTIIELTDPDRPFQGPLQGIGCFDGMFENWVVENNVILVTNFHGLTLLGAIDCSIINNTVVNQKEKTVPKQVWIMIDAHKDYNDNSLSPEERLYLRGGGNTVVNNIATWINVGPEFGTTANNSLVSVDFLDAMFVDFPNDMHLAEGSPVIDIGLNEYAPADDADGVARPVDGDGDGSSIVDLGAYEFSASWRGFSVIGNSVDSGTGLGWLGVADDPWIWSYGLSKWLYMDSSWTATTNGWVFFTR